MAHPASPEALRFTLDDDREISIPQITVGQARKALLLDPDDGHEETAKEGILRLCAQAEVLLGPAHSYLMEILQPVQMCVVIAALYRAACGMDADQYARSQAETQQRGGAGCYDTLRQLEAIRIGLATALDKMPAEIDALPMVTAIALYLEYQRAETKSAATAPGVPFTRH